ncbi:HIT domain-containing protein [Candidatus Woesearchaeota archaeon]|nr:HIT domain-containing protein [Candidatus Woesearchaeota archaeon]
MAEDQCIFCHIAQGNIPAKKVYEDDKVLAVLDINPAVQGHILLLPKEHVAVMPQMKDEIVAHTGMVAKQLSASLIRSMKVEGTSIFVANGAAAGQRAPHFMMHIMPRSKNDGVKLDLPEGKLDEKMMNMVFVKLAPAVGKQLGFEPKVSVQKEETPDKKKENVKPEKEKLPKKEPVPDDSNKADTLPSNQIPLPKKENTAKNAKGQDSLDDIADFLTRGPK